MTAVLNQIYRNPQSGSYAVQLTDYYVPYTGTGVADTFLLPSASIYTGTTQQFYIFKNVGGGSISLITAGADTIEKFYSTYPLFSRGTIVRVVSDGVSNWEIT